MPDPTYVEVAPVLLRGDLDNKYKSYLPKIAKAIGAAINKSSKLTTDEPKQKGAKGFYVSCELWLSKTDDGIEGEIKTVVADWPGKKMLKALSSKAPMKVPNPARIDKNVEELVDAIQENAQKAIVKDLEGRVK